MPEFSGQAATHPTVDDLVTAFKKVDKQGDGTISRAELVVFLTAAVPGATPFTAEQAEAEFARFDPNSEGRVSSAELAKAWASSAAAAGAPAGLAAEQPASSGPFNFESGLHDCCTVAPGLYKVAAEIPNARLIEMTMGPGDFDTLHEHPSHSMYFVTSAKLEIRDGNPLGEPHVAEVPAGAAPIFPAGPHAVKNLGGDTKVLFVEALPGCKPCGDFPAGAVTPFQVSPSCYTILAENDDWITGKVVLKVGEVDTVHSHKDHLIYVLEGDEVTLFPDGDKDKPVAVPIKPGAGIPAPISVGLFKKHAMKNSGTVDIVMIFFEMKK